MVLVLVFMLELMLILIFLFGCEDFSNLRNSFDETKQRQCTFLHIHLDSLKHILKKTLKKTCQYMTGFQIPACFCSWHFNNFPTQKPQGKIQHYQLLGIISKILWWAFMACLCDFSTIFIGLLLPDQSKMMNPCQFCNIVFKQRAADGRYK